MDELAPASRLDLDQLVEWAAELYRHERITYDSAVVRHALDQLIDDESLGRVWLLVRDGEPVGYVAITFGFSIEFGGRDAFVDELFVAEDRRGHGIGTRALELAADECRRVGVRTLHLEVERANASAQRIYRAAGFVDHDRYLMSRTLES